METPVVQPNRLLPSDPEAPQAGPKDADQVNLTDEESRIMPVSGGGFEQSYNAHDDGDHRAPHAGVQRQGRSRAHAGTDTIAACGAGRGEVAYHGQRFLQSGQRDRPKRRRVEPLLALKRESHHTPLAQRFAPDAPQPQSTDPVVQMAHRLGTRKQGGRCTAGASRR